MNTVLFKCVARKLIAVKRERLLEDTMLRTVSDRVRQAIGNAEQVGIVFNKPYIVSNSLPNLLAHVQAAARYAEWNLRANISCWGDGEVTVEVFDDDAMFFTLRILKSGFVSENMRFHMFLRKGVR